MSRFRLAAFDLDGTLVDSAPDLAHCLGHALDTAGLRRPGLAEATAWIGDGVEALVRRGLAAALGHAPDAPLFRRTLAAFDECYRRNLFRLSRVYPHMAAALDELGAEGLVLGCITNKREAYARSLLQEAGLAERLRFIYGGDSFRQRKPHPEPLLRAAAANECAPRDCVMIGDSANDREAAAAAGFAFVFAAFGYGRSDDPKLCDGAAVARSAAELPKLLCPPQGAK